MHTLDDQAGASTTLAWHMHKRNKRKPPARFDVIVSFVHLQSFP
jgi:hypothetical protein